MNCAALSVQSSAETLQPSRGNGLYDNRNNLPPQYPNAGQQGAAVNQRNAYFDPSAKFNPPPQSSYNPIGAPSSVLSSANNHNFYRPQINAHQPQSQFNAPQHQLQFSALQQQFGAPPSQFGGPPSALYPLYGGAGQLPYPYYQQPPNIPGVIQFGPYRDYHLPMNSPPGMSQHFPERSVPFYRKPEETDKKPQQGHTLN